MFLKEIQKSKLRRIRIKQILLLIIRICIIVFLVLAFSNPVYRGYFSGSNPDIRKCGIFVLDNSFSMGVKDEKGSSYEQARSTIKNILSLYSSSDRLFLVTSSHLKGFEKGELNDIQSLTDSINNLELTSVRFDLQDMMNYAGEIIKKNNSPLYEVFILSDNQKNNYQSVDFNEKFSGVNTDNIHFYNIDFGRRAANNISIEKAEVKTKIPEVNREIKVSVILKNHNKFNCLNKQVNLFVNNKKAGEYVTDIASLERKEITISFKPENTGSLSGYIELLQPDFFEDEVLQDNKYYFTIYIPDKINVGLAGENESALRYIKLAAESAEKLNNSERNIYNFNGFQTINSSISNSDMIFISGKNSFTESEIDLLDDYIKNGGGVMIFPSKNINIESYNSLLRKISSFRIENISRTMSDTGIQNNFSKIDFEHPLFYGAFKNEELTKGSGNYFIESPKIYSLFGILPGNDAKILMTLQGGEAFISESNSGEGKILFCSVSADEDMSDFPRKSLFPLIINKSILYLGNGEFKNENNTVGKNNIITIGKNKLFSVPYSEKYGNQGIFKLQDSALNQEMFFALNRDSLESDFSKADLTEIKSYFSKHNVNNIEYITEPDAVNSEIIKAREGKELWRIFTVLALLFILLEMAYAKKLEKL